MVLNQYRVRQSSFKQIPSYRIRRKSSTISLSKPCHKILFEKSVSKSKAHKKREVVGKVQPAGMIDSTD